MRLLVVVTVLILMPRNTLCQYKDVQQDIEMVPNGFVAQQQWQGDMDQMFEPLGKTMVYLAESTNAQAISGMNTPGVWGQDEGPSAALPAADGRILWIWGDTVTAFQGTIAACLVGGTNWCSFQNSGYCTGSGLPVSQGCLGVDTVSFISSADVANLGNCTHLQSVDDALISGAVPPTDYSRCAKMVYIVDLTNHGRPAHQNIPYAGFTFEHASGLSVSESMLAGETATGAFVLDNGLSPSNLYVVYTVLLQQMTSPGQYRTESILLTHTNTSLITASAMPELVKNYTFSSAVIPTGTVSVLTSGTDTTVTWLSGPLFPTSWTDTSQWTGIEIEGGVYAIKSITGCIGGPTCYLLLNTISPPPNSMNTPYNTLPADGNPNPGKFMFVAPEVLKAGTIDALGLTNQLPTSLRHQDILCFWGSSFNYRASNVYLGCMLATDAAVTGSTNPSGYGVSGIYYFAGVDVTGAPVWQDQVSTSYPEAAAVPLLSSWTHNTPASPGTPCVGEVSVRWIPPLNRFLMTYGSDNCGGLWYRTASAPWGPWSTESQLLWNAPSYGWSQAIIYFQNKYNSFDFNRTPAVRLLDPVTGLEINSDNIAPYNSPGNAYGPYLLPGFTAADNGDGTVVVLMNVSGFNPYMTWQCSARFYKHPSVRVSPGVEVSPGVSISD